MAGSLHGLATPLGQSGVGGGAGAGGRAGPGGVGAPPQNRASLEPGPPSQPACCSAALCFASQATHSAGVAALALQFS